MQANHHRLLDASQLLQLYEAIRLLLFGIVVLGIAVEFVCLLLMWLGEPAWTTRYPRRSAALYRGPEFWPKMVSLLRHSAHF